MKVHINEKLYDIHEAMTLHEAADIYKPGASVFVLNGMARGSDTVLQEGDRLVLIRLGEMPSAEELASMLTARNSPGVYDVLRNATVGIAGLGGLGSHVAAALVRMGTGKLIGADFDIVEPSNINRQNYFLDQIGMEKSAALKATLERISPLTELELVNVRITEDNASAFFKGCDVVIEAFDLSYSKIMFFETWQKHRFSRFFIGASGVSGYIDKPSITVKKFNEGVYMVGDFTSDPSLGLMASRVSIAASMQANLALQLLLGLQ